MRKSRLEKVFSNNYLKLYQLAFDEKGKFFSEIERVSDIFGIKKFDFNPIDPGKFRKGENFKNIIKFGNNQLKKFFNKISNKKKIKFFEEINKSRERLKLGREWNETIIRVVLSGVFYPPLFAVYYEDDPNDDVIRFEINRNTTKFDLDLAWENSAGIRKKMFGKEKAFYATKKTINNLNMNIEAIIKKHLKSNKNEKISDKQIVIEIFENAKDDSEKADKKRVNRLRTNRHRQKKKLN